MSVFPTEYPSNCSVFNNRFVPFAHYNSNLLSKLSGEHRYILLLLRVLTEPFTYIFSFKTAKPYVGGSISNIFHMKKT